MICKPFEVIVVTLDSPEIFPVKLKIISIAKSKKFPRRRLPFTTEVTTGLITIVAQIGAHNYWNRKYLATKGKSRFDEMSLLRNKGRKQKQSMR